MKDEKTLPFWRARDALMSLHKALIEFHSSSLGEDWRCLRVKKHIDDAIKVLEDANAKAEGGMDYEALAKKAIERLDKMTDEELNKDFRDYCGLTDEDFLEDAGSEEEEE